MLGTVLDCPVATKQPGTKKDTHLRHHRQAISRSCCYLYGSQKIFLAISAQDTYRQLGTGEDNRLFKSLKHEAES